MSYTYPGMNKSQNRGKVPGMIMVVLGTGLMVFFISSLIQIENGIKAFQPESTLFYAFPVVAAIALIFGFMVWKWDDKRTS